MDNFSLIQNVSQGSKLFISLVYILSSHHMMVLFIISVIPLLWSDFLIRWLIVVMISPIFYAVIFIVIISMSIIIASPIAWGMAFLIMLLVMVFVRANTVLLVGGPVNIHLLLLLLLNLLFIVILRERSGIFFFISLYNVFLSTVNNIVDVLVMITLISWSCDNFLLFFILIL